MIRQALLSITLLLAGCSNLTEEEGGAVALQITQPASDSLQVGQSMTLSAQALGKDGNPVDATITWRASRRAPSAVVTRKPSPTGSTRSTLTPLRTGSRCQAA